MEVSISNSRNSSTSNLPQPTNIHLSNPHIRIQKKSNQNDSSNSSLSDRKPNSRESRMHSRNSKAQQRRSAPPEELLPIDSFPSRQGPMSEPLPITIMEISTPTTAKKYAGSAFSSSPAAHKLPIPKFGINKSTNEPHSKLPDSLDANLSSIMCSSSTCSKNSLFDSPVPPPPLSSSFDNHYYVNQMPYYEKGASQPSQRFAHDHFGPRSCKNCTIMMRLCDTVSPICSSCRSSGEQCTWGWTETSPPRPMPIYYHQLPPPSTLNHYYHIHRPIPPLGSHSDVEYSNTRQDDYLSQTLKDLLQISPKAK